MRREFIVIVFILFLIGPGVAQNKDISFKHLSTTDGLSNFTVLSIAQDHQGFMWFGTMDGLNRFDGKQIKTYRQDFNEPNSLGNNEINTLLVSSDSGMWVGTSRGLYYYNFKYDNFRHIPILDPEGIAIQNIVVRALLVQGRNLWIGTNEGLFCYEMVAGQFSNLTELLSQIDLPLRAVSAIKRSEDGSLWIGHTRGLLRYREGSFESISLTVNGGRNVISIEIDALERLWIGTAQLQYGLIIYDPKDQSQVILSQKDGYVPHNRINCLYHFDDENIWIGTTWGLAIINIKTLTSEYLFYNNHDPGSISQNSIKQIFQSKNGIVWVCTYSGGVNYFDPRSQHISHVSDKYGDDRSINFNIVSSIFEDDSKKLWIGTEYGGVNMYDNEKGKFTVYRSESGKNSLINDNIKSFAQDEQGRIFVATQFGLSIYDQVQKTFFNINSDLQPIGPRGRLSFNIVHDLCRDKYGDIWIGTTGLNGRFQKYDVDLDTIIHYIPIDKNFPSLSRVVVNALEYDKHHDVVWAGGYNGLIGFELKTNTYLVNERFYPLAKMLENTVINDLLVDDNGQLWIATFGQGLFVMDLNTYEFRHVDKEDGLMESSFYGLSSDKNGNIWISTSAHLLKIEPSENINDKIISIQQFGIQEGFPSQQYFKNSACSGADGTMYFGGDDGYISFNPEELENIIINPKVVISDLLINGQPLQIESEVKGQYYHVASRESVNLAYQQSSFALHFIAPNFINPDNTWYQYQLSGVHNSWQDLGKSNSINFTNLKAGDYEIKLRASSDQHSFSDTYTTISFSVAPPPWATPMAFALYVLILLVMLYIFFLISRRWERMSQHLKMEHNEREREKVFHQRRVKFFTDISHELRTPLTLILAPIDRLIKSNLGNAKIKNQLMLMLRNGERMLQLINQLLDLRKLETGHMQIQVAKGNISRFINEVSLSFKELAENRGIKFLIKSQPEKINVWFDRDKFEIILFNLLSNALKFTQDSGEITISVEEVASSSETHEKKEKSVQIMVSNTGKGIPEDQIAHIFKRFYSGESTSININHSSGVGLEIVKELVDLHQGSISVTSRYDNTGYNGLTVFSLTLFKGKNHFDDSQLIKGFKSSEDITNYKLTAISDPGDFDEEKALEENKRNHYDQSVLIVEDNAEVRSFIVDIFYQEYSVFIAGNGNEGLARAKQEAPDLIISDVMMPEMDGIELCRRLKRDVVTSHIPVILLTARTAVTFKYEGLETGADDYIVKPFDIEDLKVRAKNLIRQRKLLKEKFTKDGSFLPSEITMTSVDEKFMRKVKDYILENIGTDDLTVEKIAEETGMSRANFYRKIKAMTNMSAAEFLKKIKMDHAAQLLKTNKFRVSEVQAVIGISDGDHFRKSFKMQFGIGPKEYIQKYQK